MPSGKSAGVRCIQLGTDLACRLFGQPTRPAVCRQLRPAPDLCGDSAPAAMLWLNSLEIATCPVKA
jgi:hypothetical protein